MDAKNPDLLTKLKWASPWLVRYPFWRTREFFRRLTSDKTKQQHLIIMVANHFEPSWTPKGMLLDWPQQLSRLEDWCKLARSTGRAVLDHDGTPFRHTNFYPAEQYHAPILERMAELQAEGLGEVEIHLHHGVERPDTPQGLRNALVEFRDVLAEKHRCLSRMDGVGTPMYGFVHGNWALANSAGGRFCGVDEEMQILAETGCYADFTLPSAPDQSQVPKINAIYQCGNPLNQRVPHRSGPNLREGLTPRLPVIFTGPLVFNWQRRIHGLPVPRLDDGGLAANYPLNIARFVRWRDANISVEGKPEWIFIKLYSHGFFDFDQSIMIGSQMLSFLEDVMKLSEQGGQFKVHFASAREFFNIALAAVDGCQGEPGLYRDYRLRLIMNEHLSPEINN